LFAPHHPSKHQHPLINETTSRRLPHQQKPPSSEILSHGLAAPGNQLTNIHPAGNQFRGLIITKAPFFS
ncbi:hypothetical protein, partial [Bartonella jaculi]|uniref:hypothetical protein n=1 Tax=Bartonella jaculi TaxID=686226 RepID=UPI0031EB2AA4